MAVVNHARCLGLDRDSSVPLNLTADREIGMNGVSSGTYLAGIPGMSVISSRNTETRATSSITNRSSLGRRL